MQSKNITIQDVAERAGVSISTVSRVINQNYPVKESTREKVDSAIKELNFTPNLLARSLIQNKTFTIGIIIPSIENLFYSTIVKGIEAYSKEKNYTLLMSSTDGNADEEKRITETLLKRKVDGLICVNPRKENIITGFFEKITEQIPLILVNGYHQGIQCHFVMNDQATGTLEALRYLIESGHRTLGFIRGINSYSYDMKENLFKELLSQNHLPIPSMNILKVPDGNSIDTTRQSMSLVEQRFSLENPPTAFFACNDAMAVGALNAAKKLGISVPDEFSIIGFDNTLLSQITEPPLSTVDQNMMKLGILAAKQLWKLMNDMPLDYSKIILNTQLIIRESTQKK